MGKYHREQIVIDWDALRLDMRKDLNDLARKYAEETGFSAQAMLSEIHLLMGEMH